MQREGGAGEGDVVLGMAPAPRHAAVIVAGWVLSHSPRTLQGSPKG